MLSALDSFNDPEKSVPLSPHSLEDTKAQAAG